MMSPANIVIIFQLLYAAKINAKSKAFGGVFLIFYNLLLSFFKRQDEVRNEKGKSKTSIAGSLHLVSSCTTNNKLQQSCLLLCDGTFLIDAFTYLFSLSLTTSF